MGLRYAPGHWLIGRAAEMRWLRLARRDPLRGPLALHHWPPLPAGRRPRALERERRRRVVQATRSALLAVLVRRLRAELGVPQMRPAPVHGRLCTTLEQGCPDCRAIASWRLEIDFVTGANSLARRYLFP
jgi:hypothetical protein